MTEGNGILGQYVAVSKISEEQRKLHGNTEQAAQEVVRICLERGILVPFLESRKKEVVDMMHMLFTQEEIDFVERYNARQEGARNRDRLYAALWEKLSALDRISEFPEAMASEEKLRALADEFGLEL